MYNSTNKIRETAKKSADFTKMALTGACGRFLQPDCSRPADTGSQISGRGRQNEGKLWWRSGTGNGPELEEAVLQGVSGKHTAGTEGWSACVKGGKAA